MDDMPYQTISIEQSDLARKYLVANAEQALTEQEKNQVFSNIGMKSWIDKTYPDLGGSGGGDAGNGIVGPNGSIVYGTSSYGGEGVLYEGSHYFSNTRVHGNIRMGASTATEGIIHFNDRAPTICFGSDRDVYPSGYSTPDLYSDAWIPNIAMVKRLMSTYGGRGSLEGMTDNNLSYSSLSQLIYCRAAMDFKGLTTFYSDMYLYGSAYFSNSTSFYGKAMFSNTVDLYSFAMFHDTAGFNEDAQFYSRVLVYSELYFSGHNSDRLYVSGHELYFNDVKLQAFSENSLGGLTVSGNDLFFNGRRVLTA